MRVRLKPVNLVPNLDKEQHHNWKSYFEEFGTEIDLPVVGVSRRGGNYVFLLMPYLNSPMDVFFVASSLFEVTNENIPDLWHTNFLTFGDLVEATNKDFSLISYPVFVSSDDFIWRLVEEKLSDEEKGQLLQLISTGILAGSTAS